jgi:LysM repeat protein
LVGFILADGFFGDRAIVPDGRLNAMVTRIEVLEVELVQLHSRMNRLQQTMSELVQSRQPPSPVRDDPEDITTMEDSPPPVNGDAGEIQKEPKPPISSNVRRFYDVRRGDTLYWIAQKHNLSVDELLRLNNMDKRQSIFPGQRLFIE